PGARRPPPHPSSPTRRSSDLRSRPVEAAPPRLEPCFLARHELLERDRLDLIPEPGTGAAEVRDTRLGADAGAGEEDDPLGVVDGDRKSTRLNSSHVKISYAVF